MEITIYTDSLSVDRAYNQVRVTIDVDVDDMLSQLDAVPKSDLTELKSEYERLSTKYDELENLYNELLEKFDMLDP